MRIPFRFVPGTPPPGDVDIVVGVAPPPAPASPAPAPAAPSGECPPQGDLIPAFMNSAGEGYTGAPQLTASHLDVDNVLTSSGQFYIVPRSSSASGDNYSQARFAFKLFGLGATESADWTVNMATTHDINFAGPTTVNTNKSLTAVPYHPDFAVSAQPWHHVMANDLNTRTVLYIAEHTLWVEDWVATAAFFGAPIGEIVRVISISGTARSTPFAATLTISREWSGV